MTKAIDLKTFSLVPPSSIVFKRTDAPSVKNDVNPFIGVDGKKGVGVILRPANKQWVMAAYLKEAADINCLKMHLTGVKEKIGDHMEFLAAYIVAPVGQKEAGPVDQVAEVLSSLGVKAKNVHYKYNETGLLGFDSRCGMFVPPVVMKYYKPQPMQVRGPSAQPTKG